MDITRSLIGHILKTKSIVSYLEKKGHSPVKHLTGGRISYLCPMPWHSETKPSFIVWTNQEYENFYCFGCFFADAEVLSPDFSSCKITELNKGDEVLGHDGKTGVVARKLIRSFVGKTTHLRVRKTFNQLSSTFDHEIYVLPYSNKKKRRPCLSGRNYGHYIYKYGAITKKKANKIRIGDCLCIPIKQNVQKVSNLDMDYWTEKYRKIKGPRPASFGKIHLSDDLLYLFGMYIAEGSASDRVVRFSLHAKEIHIAQRIQKTLKKSFSLYSSFFVPNGKNNSLEMTCCSSLLAKVFKEWFGDGADKKRLPHHLFCLSNEQTKNIVDGYFDGDGYKVSINRRRSETVSRQWSLQLFDILNRFKLYPSATFVKREGRKPIYVTCWFSKITKSTAKIGRYENGYYCVPVVQKETKHKSSLVYNLTINPQHSYVVNSFAVGNCQSAHNIIHLVSHLESIPARKAIEKLSDGMEFSIVDEAKIDEAQVEDALIHGKKDKNPTSGVSQTLIEISDMCHEFLKSVNNAPAEQNRIDKVWSIVDGCLRDYEFEQIENMKHEILPMLRKQQEVVYQQDQEKLKERYQ